MLALAGLSDLSTDQFLLDGPNRIYRCPCRSPERRTARKAKSDWPVSDSCPVLNSKCVCINQAPCLCRRQLGYWGKGLHALTGPSTWPCPIFPVVSKVLISFSSYKNAGGATVCLPLRENRSAAAHMVNRSCLHNGTRKAQQNQYVLSQNTNPAAPTFPSSTSFNDIVVARRFE
jgi:hypothetical protein